LLRRLCPGSIVRSSSWLAISPTTFDLSAQSLLFSFFKQIFSSTAAALQEVFLTEPFLESVDTFCSAASKNRKLARGLIFG
jgi:hypothetical protein